LLNTIISHPLSRILARSSLHGVGIKNIMGFTVAAVTMFKKFSFYARNKPFLSSKNKEMALYKEYSTTS